MQVDFYQLADSPVERVLPRICERVLADGGRLLVVTEDAAQAALLDERLWDYRVDSFLPHGRAGTPHDAVQPVLIAAAAEPVNGARNVALADGRWRDAALGFDRAFHFFDAETADAARAAWRMLGARDGLVRAFWRQEGRKWTKVG